MLQQTQAPRVDPEVAARSSMPTRRRRRALTASLGDVLRLWQGLGYPRRARNLHAAAARRSLDSGEFPSTLDGSAASSRRRSVHGAGGARVRVRAGRRGRRHQHRPGARPCGGRRLTAREVQAAADAARAAGEAWAWNQCLMDLGAVLCRPVAALRGVPAARPVRVRGVGEIRRSARPASAPPGAVRRQRPRKRGGLIESARRPPRSPWPTRRKS